jgi:hypothetical protein
MGVDIQADPSSILYQLMTVFSVPLSLIYDLLVAVFNSLNPDEATGAQLENLCSLVGVERLGKTKASGTVRCYGTVGTTIPTYLDPTPGQVRKPSTGDVFNILANPAGGVWTIGAGGSVDVLAEAVVAGHIDVDFDQITTIVNPVAGWTSVNNPGPPDPFPVDAWYHGTDVELDEDLRQRRQDSLSVPGAGSDQAIRAAVEAIAGIEACQVISNRMMTVDGVTGQNPKSFHVVVWPNTLTTAIKESVGRTIWERMPSGIESWGTGACVTVQITDDQGYVQTVKFDYATAIPMRVKVTLTKNASYPADGNAQVMAKVLEYFQGGTVAGSLPGLSVGDDVLVGPMYGAIGDIPGIMDLRVQVKKVSGGAIGVWPADSTSVVIANSEVATIIVGEISVVAT